MDEILNNLEKISNLLAENKNFSLKDFSPISKLIAETENKVIRLCSSSLQLKEKEEQVIERIDTIYLDKNGNEMVLLSNITMTIEQYKQYVGSID